MWTKTGRNSPVAAHPYSRCVIRTEASNEPPPSLPPPSPYAPPCLRPPPPPPPSPPPRWAARRTVAYILLVESHRAAIRLCWRSARATVCSSSVERVGDGVLGSGVLEQVAECVHEHEIVCRKLGRMSGMWFQSSHWYRFGGSTSNGFACSLSTTFMLPSCGRFSCSIAASLQSLPNCVPHSLASTTSAAETVVRPACCACFPGVPTSSERYCASLSRSVKACVTCDDVRGGSRERCGVQRASFGVLRPRVARALPSLPPLRPQSLRLPYNAGHAFILMLHRVTPAECWTLRGRYRCAISSESS